MSRLSLPGEFQIVSACCRWPPSEARKEAVRSATAQDFSWDLVLNIARRHRVEGLVADGVRRAELPVAAEIEKLLSAEATKIAYQNIAMASETIRIQQAADAAGIQMIVLKGITLNVRAYGTWGVKKAWDIDLLVPALQQSRATDMLIALGYSRISPGPNVTERQAVRWMQCAKETVWLRKDGMSAVELHSALTDNPRMMPGIGHESPLQAVAVSPGYSVRTLRDPELFAYLCVHGAVHGWSRLKWLADLAAFVNSNEHWDAEALHREAVSLGVGRSSAQALLLCSDLLGMALPRKLVKELRADIVTRWLVAVARRAMVGKHPERELDESLFGTVEIQLSHFFLRRGFAYKVEEAKQKLKNPSGPDFGPFSFVRPLVSVPHWIWRRRRMKGGKEGPA